MDQKKIVLTTENWHYKCGDGCCDEYGQNLYIDGEQLEGVDIHMNAYNAIEQILKHLGYEVEWEEIDEI